jgi:hypothetical protein
MTETIKRPTDKQIALARTLLEECEGIDKAEAIRSSLNAALTAGTLSFLDVSNAIDGLIAVKKTTATPMSVTATKVIEEGMYQRDGEIYRVKRSMTSGRLYAVRLRKETATTLKLGEKLSFQYNSQYIRKLSPTDRMTLEQAKAAGVLMGCCCVCGATLTNETSVREGIGPVCGGRV